MKSYEERAKEILASRDRILREKRIKRKKAEKCLAGAFVSCAVLITAVNLLKNPQLMRPLPDIQVIEETTEPVSTTTVAETSSPKTETTSAVTTKPSKLPENTQTTAVQTKSPETAQKITESVTEQSVHPTVTEPPGSTTALSESTKHSQTTAIGSDKTDVTSSAKTISYQTTVTLSKTTKFITTTRTLPMTTKKDLTTTTLPVTTKMTQATVTLPLTTKTILTTKNTTVTVKPNTTTAILTTTAKTAHTTEDLPTTKPEQTTATIPVTTMTTISEIPKTTTVTSKPPDIAPVAPAQPVTFENLETAIEKISNYDLEEYPFSYWQSYEYMFEILKEKGYILTVSEETASKYPFLSEQVVAFPYGAYEDVGIAYYLKNGDTLYQVMIYYTYEATEYERGDIYDYLTKRLGLNIVSEITMNDNKICMTKFGIGSSQRNCANFFIEENIYCTVRTTDTEENLISFLNELSFDHVELK